MSQEHEVFPVSGWLILPIVIAMYLAGGVLFVIAVSHELVAQLTCSLILELLAVTSTCGFIIVQPNSSKVLLLFGAYKGTVKRAGYSWVNPFMTKNAVSLRARTLNGDKLKVNDLAGNPVEIAAVVVWCVKDTFVASFEVDNYVSYVQMQSETAVRHLASAYPYDAGEDAVSLSRNTDDVSKTLQEELQQRLQKAGVEVLAARLSHLAYAPEIANAMLRRQQASAIIAARQKIVEGAVGMVEMALDRLEEYSKLTLDEERKAAMVSNLLVVLCSEHATQPVVNTGTLYQ